jgi:hypothetical protein
MLRAILGSINSLIEEAYEVIHISAMDIVLNKMVRTKTLLTSSAGYILMLPPYVLYASVLPKLLSFYLSQSKCPMKF